MKVFNRLMTFFNIKQQRKMVAAVMLGGCLLIVTFCGCNSYDSQRIISARQRQNRFTEINESRNPILLFGPPSTNPNPHYRVSAESFGRYDWPVAQVPQGYASHGESITYQEYSYSNQYLSGDNVPRYHYQRQSRSLKVGAHTRY